MLARQHKQQLKNHWTRALALLFCHPSWIHVSLMVIRCPVPSEHWCCFVFSSLWPNTWAEAILWRRVYLDSRFEGVASTMAEKEWQQAGLEARVTYILTSKRNRNQKGWEVGQNCDPKSIPRHHHQPTSQRDPTPNGYTASQKTTSWSQILKYMIPWDTLHIETREAYTCVSGWKMRTITTTTTN